MLNILKKTLSNVYLNYILGIIFIYLYIGLFMPLGLDTVKNSLLITLIVYLASAITTPKITKFLLVEDKYYILPVMVSAYCFAIALIVIFRIDYSRLTLIYGFIIVLSWLFISSFLSQPRHRLQLNAINNFDIEKFNNKKKIDLQVLEFPYQLKDIRQGLVVNLHNNLTPDQEKFIADCRINDIRVFHSERIKEMLEGKVQTTHLSENTLEALQPPPLYFIIKRFWESALIILSIPVLLPLLLLIGGLIKIESKGPIFYTQNRVGQGGKVFKIYKFRSMQVNSPMSDSKFATEERARVTNIGRFIRKTRIDEIPQFFNVLKGEMALIGPRPEQEAFVKTFEKEIPFYGYRHILKPGITGWAQTVQGYTADTESTKEKLAHDLYYIKHLSFWLDVNIFYKTLKTMLTGFGAK